MSNQPSMLDGVQHVSERREEDFYPTPAFQTRFLVSRLPQLRGLHVCEPCVGDGAIVRELEGVDVITTNDIVARPPMVPDFLLDATRPDSWQQFTRLNGPIDVGLTNPGFNVAFDVAKAGYDEVRVALIMLLRITWCEPTEDRCDWLWEHPPTLALVMPRYSYRKNGSGDSATTAWFVWAKDPTFCRAGFDFLTWAERDRLIGEAKLRAHWRVSS
jgi:hypothetical protein